MKPIAEIVESQTAEVIAQSLKIEVSPPFGAFVKVGEEKNIYGIVCNVQTQSIDPNRKPMAFGLPLKELHESHPQINQLLKTEISIAVVGFKDKKQYYQIVPTHPPVIHSPVFLCPDDEVRAFTNQLDFLRILYAIPNFSDDLLITCSNFAIESHQRDREYIVRFGKELSHLMNDNYDRFRSILRRLA